MNERYELPEDVSTLIEELTKRVEELGNGAEAGDFLSAEGLNRVKARLESGVGDIRQRLSGATVELSAMGRILNEVIWDGVAGAYLSGPDLPENGSTFSLSRAQAEFVRRYSDCPYPSSRDVGSVVSCEGERALVLDLGEECGLVHITAYFQRKGDDGWEVFGWRLWTCEEVMVSERTRVREAWYRRFAAAENDGVVSLSVGEQVEFEDVFYVFGGCERQPYYPEINKVVQVHFPDGRTVYVNCVQLEGGGIDPSKVVVTAVKRPWGSFS